MLWFYERDKIALRLETRYDNKTADYVAVLVMSQISAERCAWPCPLSRRSFVIIQQAAEPRTPMDPPLASPRRTPIDKPILESLVIPLAMVVIDKLVVFQFSADVF